MVVNKKDKEKGWGACEERVELGRRVVTIFSNTAKTKKCWDMKF